jgi:hypothetical protein
MEIKKQFRKNFRTGSFFAAGLSKESAEAALKRAGRLEALEDHL